MPRWSTCSRLSCFLTKLGRRNLNPASASLLRGLLYNREKTVGHGKKSAGNSCPQNTAQKLSAEHGVSERTIKNDGQFAAAVAALKPVVLSSSSSLPMFWR